MALPLEAIARNMGFLQHLDVCQTPYPIMMADAAVALDFWNILATVETLHSVKQSFDWSLKSA